MRDSLQICLKNGADWFFFCKIFQRMTWGMQSGWGPPYYFIYCILASAIYPQWNTMETQVQKDKYAPCPNNLLEMIRKVCAISLIYAELNLFTKLAPLSRFSHRVAMTVRLSEYLSGCLSGCLSVCAIVCCLWPRPVIGLEITWSVPGLSLVLTSSLPPRPPPPRKKNITPTQFF